MQVAKDLAELQAAVGQQLHPLEQLGAPYRVVKAFRALLFTAATDIASNPLLAELPPAITLQHLFSRCTGLVSVPGGVLQFGRVVSRAAVVKVRGADAT